MMASRALLVLGLLIADTFFDSSAAAGRELAEETKGTEANQAAGVEDQKYGGGYGGGYGSQCPNGAEGGCGGRCSYGCCHRGYYGGCRCCSHPDEMPDAEYLAEPHY